MEDRKATYGTTERKEAAMGKKPKARRRRMTIPLPVLMVWLVCAVLTLLVLGVVAINIVLNMGE